MRVVAYGLFLLLPVAAFNYLIMPKMNELKDFYANMDVYVEQTIKQNDIQVPYDHKDTSANIRL